MGKPVMTAYDAKNESDESIRGQAIHTVVAMGKDTSDDGAGYVDLIQCFCFQEHTYPAHEEVTLPLSFTVRPDTPKGVHTLTFGYTLYRHPGD